MIARPVKTGRRTSSCEIGIFDPEVKLIDASASLEVRLSSGLEVPDEPSLRCVDGPVAIVASLADCGQGSTHLRDLVKNQRVSTPIGLDSQLLLPHVGESSPICTHIMLSPLGAGGMSRS